MARLILYPAVDGVVQDTLAQAYVAGSGTITLTSGGSIFAGNPTKFTIITAGSYNQGPAEVSAVYQCTGQSGNILSGVAVLAGSTDQNFPAGSYVEIRINAIDINTLNTLVAPLNSPGQSGFVMTSTGPGTAPIWAAASSGSGSVTTVSIASANGLAGSVANANTTPAITLTTSVTGIVKGNGTGFVAATPGTDYIATNPVFVASGTSHAAGLVPDPGSSAGSTHFLREDATWAVPPGSGSGTVTTASVVTANGFAGTVANATTTPAITITTSVTGILKGNGTAMSAATAGTDYVIPSGNITGTASNVTGTVAIANGGTGLTSGITGLVKGSGTAYAAATAGTDYQAPITGTAFLPVAINSGGTAPVASSTPVIPTVAASYASTTIFDMSQSNYQQVTLAGNAILTLSNVTIGQRFTLELYQDGTGSRTVTWFGGITWVGGSPPTLQTAPGTFDSIAFRCVSAGVYEGYPSGFPVPGISGQIPHNNGTTLVGSPNATVDSNSLFNIGSAVSDPGTQVQGSFYPSSGTGGAKYALAPGLVQGIGGRIFRCGACTAVASTASATSLFGSPANSDGSLTIPANTLKIGDMLRWSAFGTYGCTASSPTITFGIYLNGVLVLQPIQLGMTSSVAETGQFWQLVPYSYLMVTAIGASGGVLGLSIAQITINNAGTITLGSQTMASSSTGSATPVVVAFNSNALFDIKVTWGTANASNTMQVLGAALYLDK